MPFKNKNKRKAYDKKYRQENLEKGRAAAKKHYQKNREKQKARSKKYRQENPGKARAYDKKICQELTTGYVKARLRGTVITLKKYPKELIELKRSQILIHREIKKGKEIINELSTSV